MAKGLVYILTNPCLEGWVKIGMTEQDGRIREREFFRISPETAYGVFYDIAKLRNDVDALALTNLRAGKRARRRSRRAIPSARAIRLRSSVFQSGLNSLSCTIRTSP